MSCWRSAFPSRDTVAGDSVRCGASAPGMARARSRESAVVMRNAARWEGVGGRRAPAGSRTLSLIEGENAIPWSRSGGVAEVADDLQPVPEDLEAAPLQ